MKTIVKYLLSASLLLSIGVHAQGKVESPSKTSMKGRKELRKDTRDKRHTEKHLKTDKDKWKTHADEPFIKKEHPNTPKGKKADETIRK
jgi:hypothetical protein